MMAFSDCPPQKLEEQNPDFFRAYYTRLKLKDQIVLFNHLLLQQVNVVQRHAGGWMHSFMPQPSLPGAPHSPSSLMAPCPLTKAAAGGLLSRRPSTRL